MRVPRPTMLLSGLIVSLCLLFAALWLLDRTTAEAALPASHSGYYKISGQGGPSSAPAIPSPSETIEPLPPGVSVQPVITDLVNYGAPRPMYMQFDPQGRIFFTNQPGEVRLIANGVLQPSPVITFDVAFNPFCEIGLFGLALDPNFGSNHYVYVAYTAGTYPSPTENRVVRFTESNGHGSNPVTIFTSPQVSNDWSMGAIHFGPDGKLYVAVGDDSNPANAQDVTVKQGKIHRINPNGTIPPDNPVFTQTGALPSLYAIGLRSGRDFTFDSISNNLFANDSGTAWDAMQGCDDEVNRIVGGYDYGWRPVYPCDDTNQGGPDPRYNTIPPMWSAGNPSTVNPMGIEVYRGTSIPEWTNDLFQCSMSDSYLRRFHLSADRTQVLSVTRLMIPCGTDITTGPDGALYFFGLHLPDSNIGLFRIVGSGGLQTPTATATPSCTPGFTISATGPGRNLLDVSALTADDAWTVGQVDTSTLIEHWNGTQWTRITSPNPGSSSNELVGVYALSAGDTWAVGEYRNTDSSNGTLIQHWNGTEWIVAASPSVPQATENLLISVYGRAANDVWAVGFSQNASGNRTALVEHWDGTQWSIVPTASAPGNFTELFGVQAFAADNVWASGEYAADPYSTLQTLVEHWDGTQWHVVASPNVPGAANYLARLSGHAPDDIWAVGDYQPASGPLQALIEHWNGTQWTIMPGPSAGVTSSLFGVSALSPGQAGNDVWAVGSYEPQGQSTATLVEHWDGTQWSIVPSANQVGSANELAGVSALFPGNVWAVGDVGVATPTSWLIEHYDGSCPTATPTIAPPTTTATRTPSPTATPSCVPGFSIQALQYTQGGQSVLLDAVPLAANNVWVAGSSTMGTVVERWDGSQWNTVQSPSPGQTLSEIIGLAAVSANDIWAVGDYNDQSGTRLPLIEHWDGSTWSVVPAPAPNPGDENRLMSVSAYSANDVWAVGSYRIPSNSTYSALIEHWDGTQWSLVPGAQVGPNSWLCGVQAFAGNDVWASGSVSQASVSQTLIEHWDGTQWSVVPSPNVQNANNLLSRMAGTSPSDIWAVGYTADNNTIQTLTMHWDGTQWSIVPSPNPNSSATLFDIAVMGGPGSSEAWATGYYEPQANHRAPLVEHWNGTQWSLVPVSVNSTNYNALWGVGTLSQNDVWAVGTGDDGSNYRLIEHYDDSCPTATPTITPTSPPATATATRTPSSVASSTPTRTVSATPTATCMPGFNVEYIRDEGTQLLGMSASSANDAWAVGFGPGNGSGYALVEHWNGTQWSTLDVPPAPELYCVSARSPSDVWVAGEGTAIEHWDGVQWQITNSPAPSQVSNTLYGISALSQNDVWAVGRYLDTATWSGRVLIEHWDGTAWSLVPGINPGATENRLQSVMAFAPDNVWAVGGYGGPSGGGALIEHWDGTQWSLVPGATIDPPPALFGVSGTGPNDIWAVGINEPNGQGSQQTITEHWNGTQWSLVPSPSPGRNDLLYAVKAIAPNDVWAVGYYHTDIQRNLVLHWDGTQWNVVPGADPATQMNFLLGVAASPPGPGQRVWAAGYGSNGSGSFTVVEKYVPSCTTTTPTATQTTTPTIAPPTWTPTLPPSGTPTSVAASTTPNIATGTPTAGTASATATRTPVSVASPTPSPTICSVEFPDVLPGSTFYQYVHCLACRGIITGYPDGTFGPNNPVTRGQLSKIVSNSAGYNETFSTNTFEDVPVGSTFFSYVERLYLHGGIGGYACGGVGEPCIPPGNKPYFRPNANVTRGQTAKIVAIARQLPAPNPGQQTFEDVSEGSPFWQWIEPLASSEAIGGYPCGGQGEPCVPPGNRPYFRPNANVTRGQSAKIVSTAYFPNCAGQ